MRPPKKMAVRSSLVGWLLLAIAGCNRAGGSPEVDRTAVSTPVIAKEAEELEIDADDGEPDNGLIPRLERLRKSGEFSRFVDAALTAAETQAPDATLHLLKAEALLAIGRHEAAGDAALSAAQLAIASDDLPAAGHALKLFAVARFRERQSLDDPAFDGVLARLPADDPAADLLRFWRAAIAQSVPYQLDSSVSEPSEVQARQSSPAALGAIEVRANGIAQPLVFIDTGGQHSLMTTAAARRAGVTIGTTATQLVGFAGLRARPAVLETLQLGGLTLRNVPILVGDSAPLVALKGQMTLGTELMHHICFTIDYPADRVLAEPADRGGSVVESESNWQIPLWTFSQVCLVQGRTAAGAGARLLVDTGNRTGTFVSARWARRNLPRYQPPDAGLVFKFKQRDLKIESLEFGDQSLDDWPVVDTLPGSLERLDLVDVLVGHDLLRSYRVTLDVAGRTLLLRGNLPPAGPALERIDGLEDSRVGGN
jgi:hypothetical protein